jgi:hypothetical protein
MDGKRMFLVGIVLTCSAVATAHGEELGPCAKIMNACKSAGFVKNDAKEGKGIWLNCIDLIMQGKPPSASAKLALPIISSKVVSACKKKRPDFGDGKNQ